MTQEHDQYFEYLMGRSRLGHAYRRHVLYPRLVKRLRGRLLDVGCGIGDMLAFRPNSVGVDINDRTVAHCRELGLQAHVMLPDRLPFATTIFDSVLLDNVLEHIADPVPLLSEVKRVLRPGGRLLIGVPGVRGWESDSDHKVFYDETSLAACAADCGFTMVEVFHMPIFKSRWLSRHMRQYCIYGVFHRT
jgi:SAM-dependent methyltransferase